ncbi:primosomal protein N' [Flagellimonas sp. DF-77]|uniref:replication restart helicase PriA n=1 Tax=Flagellimonas algarum TaxID=3230298 RepID=UPI0033943350
MQFFLDVVLPIPLERLFTYKLSEEQAAQLRPGMRVAVPFGKRKLYTALALNIHQNAPSAYEAKEIDQILDTDPLVHQVQFEHWQWMAQYYMCTLGEVLRTALPGSLLLESSTTILAGEWDGIDETVLSDEEFLILEALRHQKTLSVDDAMAITGRKRVLPLLNGLVAQGAVVLRESVQHQYKPKLVKFVSLADTYVEEARLEALLEALRRAPKQIEALLQLFQLKAGQAKPIKLLDFEKRPGISKSAVKALIDKEILQVEVRQIDRIAFGNNSRKPEDIVLNSDQEAAYAAITSSFAAGKVCLLHGVTASGKTEIYIKKIAETLAKGQQALYLLPEIALTAQLIHRLQSYFGNQVAVYHSKYSLNERVEVWNNVLAQTDKAQIVLGARSALFLPFANLGLVIVDEEHESSFKQFDPAPRYHGRDAAIVLATMHKADCLLGSATPSIETYKNALSGKYGLATIDKRYGAVLLPDIQLVDIKEASRKKRMKGHFSDTLFEAIQDSLEDGEQIILFQNRRGFSPVIECTTCGHVAQCPNCDVSLTYHKYRNQLRCHYCGYHMAVQQSCQACGNSTLDQKGFGTEQVEEELRQLLPDHTVARMDLDTTRGKYAYERIIERFEQHEIDILVGTQMITKGLDFRNVGLVGIMNADTLLNFPDYRAHERSFQLLTQVAGRAGRTKKRGKVLIQTYNPFHQILQQVTTNSYAKMYAEQVYEREQYRYPPNCKIIKITLKSRDFNGLNEASDWFSASLCNIRGITVLGPEQPVIGKIRNEYLKNILIKFDQRLSQKQLKNGIKRIQASFHAISKYRSIKLVYNVDHI